MTTDWRCKKCGKLLGIRSDDRIHITFSRGHDYIVGLPAVGTCRGCGSLNEITLTTPLPASGRTTV
jgi:phage FluMu protein Com